VNESYHTAKIFLGSDDFDFNTNFNLVKKSLSSQFDFYIDFFQDRRSGELILRTLGDIVRVKVEAQDVLLKDSQVLSL
jgi:hypothetical protein